MNTGFICNNLSRFYMADNREKIVAFKTSSEFVALLNELCVQLGAGRSDVLRLAVSDFVMLNLIDATVFAESKRKLY